MLSRIQPAPTHPLNAALAGVTVLVVEDDACMQRLVGVLLSRLGAAVELCGNGLEAIDRVMGVSKHGGPSETIDAVMMDMDMPVLSGYQAAERLRAAGFRRPIIAVTAHATDADRQNCLQAGCDGYLAKPFGPDALLKLFQQHLAMA